MPDQSTNNVVKVDPVTLSVLWNGLVGIAEEMGSTLRRTAFSEAVRDGDDFSTAVFDRAGRLLAQGNYTPGHLGSMPYIMKHILELYPAGSFEPGDSILSNDSALGSGHYPDFFLVTPVFRQDEIVGYTVNIAHHCDVGGAVPGSQGIDGVTEAYQEGIRVLPVKAVRNGTFDKDLLRTILGNVRLPQKVSGDFLAQLNANVIGGSRLLKLMQSVGDTVFEQGVEQILDASEERMRELFSSLPDGVYSFEDEMDDAGPGTAPIRFAVDLSISGGELTVDFSRSSDQVAAGMNCYLNWTRAHAAFAIKALIGADVPNNDGAMRPIYVESRPGSFFNCTYPAPSGGRAVNQVRIFEVINGALAKVLPDRVMGGYSHWACVNLGGVDARNNRNFVLYDVIFGGYGARHDSDGVDAMSPVLNCPIIPLEVQEASNPILYRRYEFIADSGGAGRFRGGCGVRKDLELLSDGALLTLLGDRHVRAPYGIFGGKPGTVAQTILNPDGQAVNLSSKEKRRLKKGDVLSLRLAGAGGYGDPALRSDPAISSDLENGFITESGLKANYSGHKKAGRRQLLDA